MRYILHSAVITSPGLWQYTLLTPKQARAWAAAGPYDSRVGYEQAAEALEALIGMPVRVCGQSVQMKLTDEALVFRIQLKPGSKLIDPRSKEWLPTELLEEHYELGLLKRIQ